MTVTILTKNLIGQCDRGQCGGEIALTTNGAVEAYATVATARGSRYIGMECESVEKRNDGSIVVACSALVAEANERCDGSATFAPADLAEVAFAVAAEAAYMQPMEMES